MISLQRVMRPMAGHVEKKQVFIHIVEHQFIAEHSCSNVGQFVWHLTYFHSFFFKKNS